MIDDPGSLAQVQRFLIEEAELLDRWKLDEWVKLMAEDGRYLIPSLDKPAGDPADTLFLISDDNLTLNSRVKQLLGSTVWAENPRSRTRRLVSNIRLVSSDGPDLNVTANFAVWRFQFGQSDCYVGQYHHRLRRVGSSFQFVERKAVLDMEVLRPQGMLSIIL